VGVYCDKAEEGLGDGDEKMEQLRVVGNFGSLLEKLSKQIFHLQRVIKVQDESGLEEGLLYLNVHLGLDPLADRTNRQKARGS
jgi:hypothetical protein